MVPTQDSATLTAPLNEHFGIQLNTLAKLGPKRFMKPFRATERQVVYVDVQNKLFAVSEPRSTGTLWILFHPARGGVARGTFATSGQTLGDRRVTC